MCGWRWTCPIVWEMLWGESCRVSNKNISFLKAKQRRREGSAALIQKAKSLESRGKRKKSGAARPPLLFRLSGHNRSHSQPETDYAAMYLHLTGLTIRGFFSALLCSLLKEPARCVLAFHLLRATWESPVWPVNRFLCIPTSGAPLSPVCNSAEPSVTHVTLR